MVEKTKKAKENTLLILLRLQKKNPNLLNEYFNIDWKVQNEFNEFLSNRDFQLYFHSADLEEVKLQFIANKIINRDMQYVEFFENQLKEIWSKWGYDIRLFDKMDEIDTKLTVQEYIKKLKNEETQQLFFIILNYFIGTYSSVSIFSDYDKHSEASSFISKMLSVDDILEDKMYAKYTKKRTRELCEYLAIAEERLFDLFYYLFCNIYTEFDFDYSDLEKIPKLCKPNNSEFNMKDMINFASDIDVNDSYDIIVDEFGLDVNYYSLMTGMAPIYSTLNKYSTKVFGLEKETFKIIFEEALQTTLLDNLKNYLMFNEEDVKIERTMIVRFAEIENMDIFISQLCSNIFNIFVLNYLKDFIIIVNKTSNLTETTLGTDSFEKDMAKKDSEIEKLQKELEELKQKYSKKVEETESLNKKLTDSTKNLKNSYLSEISSLKKQLESSNQRISELEKDTIELTEIRKTLLSSEDEEVEEIKFEDIDLEQFKNKRYIFIGGRFELLKKLEEIFPKGKFYHTKPNSGINITKTEKIVIFPKNINHPMYWDAIDLAKNNNIPFMFTLGTNLETVIKDIIKDGV